MRRLQDACSEIRDEANELREENRRLMTIIENANLAGSSLHPSYAPAGPSSLRSSPNHNSEFTIPFTVVPSNSPRPLLHDETRPIFPRATADAAGVDPSSELPPFGSFPTHAHRLSADLDADGPWISKRGLFPPMNSTSASDFLSAGHARQLSETSSQFDFAPRDHASPGLTNSPMQPSMFSHDTAENLSDHSRSLSPSAEPQIPFNNLSIYPQTLSSMPVDYSRAGAEGGWDPSYYISPNQQSTDAIESELGRSDTVKASHYANANANAAAIQRPSSRGSQHRRAFSNTTDASADMFVDDGGFADADPYDYYGEHHSRPSSSSSSVFSYAGDMPPSASTLPPQLLNNISRVKSSRRHSFPVSLASIGDAAESSEDQEMDDGDYALSDAAATGHGHGGDSESSNTLAVIKAQAFGTVRKSRVSRPKRTGADSAAKVAMDVLQARGVGLGIDVDLEGGSLSGAAQSKRRKRDHVPPHLQSTIS